jgi:hypothetical protein
VTGLVIAIMLVALGLGYAIVEPIREHTDAPEPTGPDAAAVQRAAEEYAVAADAAHADRLVEHHAAIAEARADLALRIHFERLSRSLAAHARLVTVGQ